MRLFFSIIFTTLENTYSKFFKGSFYEKTFLKCYSKKRQSKVRKPYNVGKTHQFTKSLLINKKI